ncbi:hypothetical protein DFH06DRAFT_1326153 [Mycena polygramma]|nr:hypothetical protein DFH06DRAFT_1326153 [Mycena polygramma]
MPSPALLLSALLLSHALAQTPEPFLWDKLTPSQDLKWVKCYSTLQCTRLEVPLDYSDQSVGTAAIAVIRLPANVSQTEYRGNCTEAQSYSILVDPEEAAWIRWSRPALSFKPFLRTPGLSGVHYSTPEASFFETDAERAIWNAGSLPSSLTET